MTLQRILLAAVLGVVACGDPPPSEYPSQQPYTEDKTLGPGDVFDVRVFYGSKKREATYRVSDQRTVSLWMIGEVNVGGKTPAEVERLIRDRLADGYLDEPVVSVFVKEYNSKKISVFGEVKAPGTFPYSQRMTIVEAISLAGGFAAMARKNAVRINRAGAKPYVVPVQRIGQGKAENFFVRPGDVVFVPERPY